jgi:hypothetical protein
MTKALPLNPGGSKIWIFDFTQGLVGQEEVHLPCMHQVNRKGYREEQIMAIFVMFVASIWATVIGVAVCMPKAQH